MHMIDRNSPCWCGSGLKYKKCHYDFDEKLKMYENKGCIVPEHSMIKTPERVLYRADGSSHGSPYPRLRQRGAGYSHCSVPSPPE